MLKIKQWIEVNSFSSTHEILEIKKLDYEWFK